MTLMFHVFILHLGREGQRMLPLRTRGEAGVR